MFQVPRVPTVGLSGRYVHLVYLLRGVLVFFLYLLCRLLRGRVGPDFQVFQVAVEVFGFRLQVRATCAPSRVYQTCTFSFYVNVAVKRSRLFSQFHRVRVRVGPLRVRRFFEPQYRFRSLLLRRVPIGL